MKPDADTRSAAYLVELEAGSDEERRWRGEWLSRLMFGWMVGQSDPGSYEEWLTSQGARLVSKDHPFKDDREKWAYGSGPGSLEPGYAEQDAASEQGDGEDMGPLDPETVEKLREHGIEQPDWTPERPAARRYRSMVPKRSPAQMLDALYQAIEDSRKSLNKIGEGDWTPQDTAHSVLLARIEVVLANVPFRTGRIVHGDAE